MQRLVADVMLEKLARWIRLSGNKIESAPFVKDEKLISYVKKKKAILLTQDEALAQRSKKRGFKVVLVKGSSIEEQLAYVSFVIGMRLRASPSLICPYCNVKLEKASKKEIQGKVPERVAKSHRLFYICPKCKRIYWKGSHWKEIEKRLRCARELERKIRLRDKGLV